jgi:hypothetical protein
MKPTLFITLAALAFAGVAAAQDRDGAGGPSSRTTTARPTSLRQACENDAQSLCAGTQARERSLCLLKNLERLSPACKAALDKTAPRQQTPTTQPPPKAPSGE